MQKNLHHIGYARVEAEDRDDAQQIQTLKRLGVGGQIFVEMVSSVGKGETPELRRMLDAVRPGDLVHVTKLDRLTCSARDALEIVDQLRAKRAGLIVHEFGPMDITSDVGRTAYTVLAAVVEMERTRIRERQREGIERAKAEGRYRGRPEALSRQQQARVREMVARGVPKARIAKELGCSRTTLYKALAS